MIDKKRFYYLVQVFIDGTISEQEAAELNRIIRKSKKLKQELLSQVQISTAVHGHFMLDKSMLYRQVFTSLKTRSQKMRIVKSVLSKLPEEKHREPEKTREQPETIKLPWYAQVKYAALLMVGVLIATYFINEYQYSQTEELIRLRLREFYGKVEIERAGEIIPAEKDMQLHNSDRIRTQSDASAVMEYTDEKTRVEISPDTNVQVREEKGLKLFDMDNGRVDLSVDKQPEDGGLRVLTPHAQVDVAGTIFRVTVQEGRTHVETYDGRVSVKQKNSDKEVFVDRGERAAVSGTSGKQLTAVQIPGWFSYRNGPKIKEKRNGKMVETDFEKWLRDLGYVPGPILCIEDFENGFDTDRWAVCRPEIKEYGVIYKPAVNPERFMAVTKIKRGKTESYVLQLTDEKGDNIVTALRYGRDIISPAYLVEFDFGSSVSFTFRLGLDNRKAYKILLDQKTTLNLKNVSYHRRTLVFPANDPGTKLTWEMLGTVRGEVVSRCRVDYNRNAFIFEIQGGWLYVDNIIIRELKKLPGNDPAN